MYSSPTVIQFNVSDPRMAKKREEVKEESEEGREKSKEMNENVTFSPLIVKRASGVGVMDVTYLCALLEVDSEEEEEEEGMMED